VEAQQEANPSEELLKEDDPMELKHYPQQAY
jgi:hypothetical protein